MFKWLARKILTKEIEELRCRRDYFENKYLDSERKSAGIHDDLVKTRMELVKKKEAIEQLQNEVKNLQTQNAIMRKHCKVDEEPSEEARIRILTDLRIHDLEQEVLLEKIKALNTYKSMAATSLIYLPRI